MHSTARPHATPSARRTLERSLRTWGAVLFRYRFRVLADVAVAALVLALPLSLRAAPSFASASTPVASVAVSDTDMLASAGPAAPVRAQAVARGATITAAGDPRTAIAPELKPFERMRVGPNDSLQSIANHFKISAEAIAFSNGITNPDLRSQVGREIVIPPGEGALYTVQAEDSIESVAQRFAVDPKGIMDHNRLYFEPERFAPEKVIFVPGATVPGLVYVTANPREQVRAPSVLSRPVQAAAVSSGTLVLPVQGGSITQYFWGFHTGVDIAAAYGSNISASAAGTVIQTGWVPVGGLSVQVQHPDGSVTGYYHMGAIFVAPGQQVTQGQVIGSIGMTGVTTGPHVHWELTRNGAFANPLAYTR